MRKELSTNDASTKNARRSFIKMGGASMLSLLTLGGSQKVFADQYQDYKDQWNGRGYNGNIARYWNDLGYPVHRTVKVDRLDEGIITARVDSRWRHFKIIETEQKFRDFESSGMVNVYNKLLEGVIAMFGGVYCPTIISYGGIPRGDSKFTLNGACKFMFPCPKDTDTAQTMIDGLLERASNPAERRTWFRDQFANQDLWNFSGLLSRDETVLAPGAADKPDTPYRETHTFRNLMENPLAVILFVSNTDNQSFELRTIAHYVHQDDENANPYERKLAEFINTYANTSHGLNAKFPAIIFHTVEEFNNSMAVGQEGVRVARLKEGVKNLYAKLPWRGKSIG